MAKGKNNHRGGQPCYMPTAQQIAQACAEIRRSWSRAERRRRTVQKSPPAEFPLIAVVDLDRSHADDDAA